MNRFPHEYIIDLADIMDDAEKAKIIYNRFWSLTEMARMDYADAEGSVAGAKSQNEASQRSYDSDDSIVGFGYSLPFTDAQIKNLEARRDSAKQNYTAYKLVLKFIVDTFIDKAYSK
jgi:hypothetical protein